MLQWNQIQFKTISKKSTLIATDVIKRTLIVLVVISARNIDLTSRFKFNHVNFLNLLGQKDQHRPLKDNLPGGLWILSANEDFFYYILAPPCNNTWYQIQNIVSLMLLPTRCRT